MQQIDYVNAPAGAGKTFAGTGWIKKRITKGEKVILVQPITRLIAETVDQTFSNQGIDPSHVTEITERTRPNGGIVAAIVRHLNEAPEGKGEVLVITQAAFVKLCERHATNRDRWTVLIDEALDVLTSFCRNLPNSHELLTEHLEVGDTSDPTYWPVRKKVGSTKLDQIAKNPLRDEVWGDLQALAAAVVSPDWHVFVRADSYNALIEGADTPGLMRQLNAFCVLGPSVLEGWNRVIVMSARFTDSLMHLLWSRLDHGAVMFNDVTSSFTLRYEQHENGGLLDIYCGLDQHWSKAQGEKIVEANGKAMGMRDAFVAAARSVVGDSTVAILANNDVAAAEKLFPNGVRLPAYSHGLNTYQDIDHAVLLLAANPTPALIGLLKWFAYLSDEEIKTAIHRPMIYQAACRISLRDPANMNPKSLFVPDRGTAEWLQGVFPGARLHRLDLGLSEKAQPTKKAGRPKSHDTNADRQKAYRDRKVHEQATRLERELRLRLVNGVNIPNQHTLQAGLVMEGMSETRNISDTTVARQDFHGTFFRADLEANIGEVLPFASFDELVQVFRAASDEVHAHKEDCWLWSPSYFVPFTRNDNPNRTRCGYVNIAYCRHIILDNDGGDLTPEQFAAMFPSLRMVIYSTWSSSASCPKWRVLIPTDALLDIEGYKLIANSIIAMLKERGYHDASEIKKDPRLARQKGYRGTHGFDRTKLNPAARLFVPSQGANPEDAFFRDYAGGHRSELPVYEWIERIPVPEMPAAPPSRPAPAPAAPNPKASASLQRIQAMLADRDAIKLAKSKDRKVENALHWWSFDGDRPGQRDLSFCRLAGRLFRAGCDQFEFENHLRSAAAASRGSRSELRSKIGRLWRVVSR